MTDGPEQPPERADFGGPLSPPRPSERTLNPAHAILAGAILSAIVTLIGVTLNIRSSERLSSEREKRDAAVAEANDLKDKVGELEQKLNDAVAKIPSSSPDSTVAVTTLAPPPQSIVVVITVPTPAVTGPVGATAPTTRPAPSTTVRTATSTLEQGSTTTSASSTTSSTSSTTTTAA